MQGCGNSFFHDYFRRRVHIVEQKFLAKVVMVWIYKKHPTRHGYASICGAV